MYTRVEDVNFDEKQEPLPHIEFIVLPVENRQLSQEKGVAIMEDVEFCYIYPRGGKDKVKKIVDDGIRNRFARHYKAWKEGQEAPVDGTDIRKFEALTPAQRENCRAYHIMTIEQLAEANEETIKNMGMGGRAMKQKAIDYMAFADGGGKHTMEMDKLRAELENERVEREKLADQVKQLTKALNDSNEDKPKKRKQKESLADVT